MKWVRELVRALEIPRLARYGLTPAAAPATVAAAEKASSMKANPIALTQEELSDVLAAAL